MVFITIELIRKRSEHNEGEIGTLEEIALHQEDIEKIEYLGQWCRHLKIILLQSNLIAKIENLNKMKELEYLNLAINNIEVIENLRGCESLKKLDLTLNFIGDLTSVEALKENIHLQFLYLTGNPCADYDGYRKYVIATLPQLEELDNKAISRAERIVALQEYGIISEMILRQQREQSVSRDEQRDRMVKWTEENGQYDKEDEEENARFWASTCEHAPETRTVIAKRSRRQGPVFGGTDPPIQPPKPVKFFNEDGRPYNINQAKIPFHFDIDNPEMYTLELGVYKYLDTELLSADVEANYVRVTIKGKVFQLALPEEVQIDNSKVERSKITGRLVITMPILFPNKENVAKWRKEQRQLNRENAKREKDSFATKPEQSMREYLEIGSDDNRMDFSQIACPQRLQPVFVDNPDVPPLE